MQQTNDTKYWVAINPSDLSAYIHEGEEPENNYWLACLRSKGEAEFLLFHVNERLQAKARKLQRQQVTQEGKCNGEK